MNIEKNEKRQFFLVVFLAAVVLAISAWAFIQEISRDSEEEGNQTVENGTGGKSNTAKKKEEEQALTLEEIAEILLQKISFDTDMKPLESAVVSTMITTTVSDTKLVLYTGEGTCSDELLILRAEAEDDAGLELENVQKHLGEMQTSFEDYLPEEAKKIDDAVILQIGRYVIACVTSDDSNAKKQIEQLQLSD